MDFLWTSKTSCKFNCIFDFNVSAEYRTFMSFSWKCFNCQLMGFCLCFRQSFSEARCYLDTLTKGWFLDQSSQRTSLIPRIKHWHTFIWKQQTPETNMSAFNLLIFRCRLTSEVLYWCQLIHLINLYFRLPKNKNIKLNKCTHAYEQEYL